MVTHRIDTNSPIDYCSICRKQNNIFHLLVTCPQYNGFRQGIFSYLDSNELSHSVNHILNDEFPLHVLFDYLKNVNYFDKI